MEKSVDDIAKHNPNRNQQEAKQISRERRNIFRFLHSSACDGTLDNCKPEYVWCCQIRSTVQHVLDCSRGCNAACLYLRQIGLHIVYCRDRTCDLCPYKYLDIDDERSEEENDVENGVRYVRGDHLDELVDPVEEDTEKAEDEE